ncbi:nuclear envelope pore membrane protein POM 121 [Electrophorus electricus]|uniref:POM121 transmembrane nucleoporin n=1 Tax=Electrophorus electricus TaxID=8005 RepID=A0A4W4GKB2_ELEEL|nr:nuclear envelope pore membrane protein POM 121 [Electrophorus electricus]
MSPEDKRRLAFTSVALLLVALFFFVLSYIPTYLYILFFFLGSCGVCCYKAEEFQLFDRLGLHPRRGLAVPSVLLRWLPGRTLRGAPAAGRNKTRTTKSDVRNSLASPCDRHFASSTYRRDASFSDSVFSPRDILMGSYLAKPESPSGAGRPVGGSGTYVNPREQLRERLIRPNHGLPIPNRRLSFGDPMGTVGRFTITPQRHYPLQQMGTSSVGVLPPAQWDGFSKKNILTQRNAPLHSPVTVKIARPDSTTRSSFFDQLNSPGAHVSPGFGVQADPCSRETVLSVLRESRKRDVDDEDKDRASGQKSKRRRQNSSESSQSAFEPLLANGTPSQLVPKPGSLKRGINASVMEESTLKRSRTSSISSVGGGPASCGVPGSARNPIRSSYSSSQGCPQRRVMSSLSLSPLASPGSSRCQTPERVAKKPREEDATSPSSASSVKSDKAAADLALGSGKRTPTPEAPVMSLSDSGGSNGKRKRKIPLVSTRRGDQISLPPPPELGYTITVKDLDMEKKAVLSQIHKVLKEPEPEKPAPGPIPGPIPGPTLSVGLFSHLAPATSATVTPAVSAPSLASLSPPSAGPALASTTTSSPAPAPTIDLTVTPTSTASSVLAPVATPPSVTPTSGAAVALSLANTLQESLQNMKNSSLLTSSSLLTAASAAPTAPTAASPVPMPTAAPAVATAKGPGVVKPEPALSTPQPTVPALPAPSAAPMPSAFAQILAQPLQPSSIFSVVGNSLIPSSTLALTPVSAAPTPITMAASTAPASTTAQPAPSGFKPIFGVATTAPASAVGVKPTQPTFKPIFGSAGLSAFGQPATSASSTPATKSSTPMFSSLTTTQPQATSVPSSTPAAQAPSQSVFSSWGAASTSSVPAPSGTFQFRAPSSTSNTATSSSTTTNFQFNAIKPTQTAPPAVSQSTFTFGQVPAAQNSTASPFGGFGMANSTSTTAANTSTTQAAFGSSVFSVSTSFPSVPAQAPAASKPFTFGAGSGSNALTPFTFGAPASTAAPAFGTPAQPAFGGASTGFSFGNTTSQLVAPAFGATTQVTASVPGPTFTFGAAQANPQNSSQGASALPPSGGFNFAASLSGAQFGTPTPAAQTPGFSFGASNTDTKPAFGTSTPVFGTGGGPIPFGSPGTPVQGFSASSFATPSATFSIGAGSKPSGARQRLQARRQHVRKK